MIDLYPLYRRSAEPRRPFDRFFDTAAFEAAFRYLTEQLQLPESAVLRRTKGQKQAPATALAHPLLALEFVRWLDFNGYADKLMRLIGEPPCDPPTS